MLPVHVALVPYDPEPSRYTAEQAQGLSFHQDLFHVAAALQAQVTRDFAPLWGVSGVISPFLSLDHVPPGYVPLVIAPPGTLTDEAAGFHLAMHGRPVALIEYGPAWSLLASHELLELICDPFGRRTVRGGSIVDDEYGVRAEDGNGEEVANQGQVEYLVEVCDPCQSATYTINGVLVSDFVTPQYYDPFPTAGARYSYTGAVGSPRRLLKGSYVSWCTPWDGHVWQAVAPALTKKDRQLERPPMAEVGDLTVTPIGIAPEFTRGWIDSATNPLRPEVVDHIRAGLSLKPAEQAYTLATQSASRHGRGWRHELAGFIDEPSGRRVPDPGRAEPGKADDKVLALLDKLATDDGFRARFAADPVPVLEEEGIVPPLDDIPAPGEYLPPKARYRAIRDAAKGGQRFGPDVNNRDTPPWLCSLIHG